jgi:hypothetical protein
MPCSMQFLMLSVLRSSDRASSVIFTTAPRSAATAGLAFSSYLRSPRRLQRSRLKTEPDDRYAGFYPEIVGGLSKDSPICCAFAGKPTCSRSLRRRVCGVDGVPAVGRCAARATPGN